MTYNHCPLPYVNKASDLGSWDHSVFSNEDMITDMKRKESYAEFGKIRDKFFKTKAKTSPLAKLLERRTNHSVFANHTVSSSPYVSQVPSDHCSTLDNHLTIEDNILGTAQHRLPRNFVSRSLERDEVIKRVVHFKNLTVSTYSSLL